MQTAESAAAATTRAKTAGVQLIRDAAALRRLAPEWNELAEVQSIPSFFVSFEWVSAWWRAYGAGKELFVLASYDDDGRICCIAPLYRSHARDGFRRVLRWIGDGTDDVDGFGPLVRPGRETQSLQLFLSWLATHDAEWDLIELGSMIKESSVVALLQKEVESRKWITVADRSPRRVLHLPKSWDDYLQTLPRKNRQTLLRKMRTIERDFLVGFSRCTSDEEIEDGLLLMFDLHQAQWLSRGHEGKFSLQDRRDFYRDICRSRQNVDLWQLKLNDQVAAIRLGFRARNTRHAVVAAMDIRLASYGVGTVIEALVIKESIERGDLVLDYLGGDEPYKSEMGARRHEYVSLRIARPRTRTGIGLAAENLAQHGKHWLKQRFPNTRSKRGRSE